MAKELSEESKFQISVKTLITIVVGVATIISAYFGLMASINSKFVELEDKVERALELPKPGTGTYTIDIIATYNIFVMFISLIVLFRL